MDIREIYGRLLSMREDSINEKTSDGTGDINIGVRLGKLKEEDSAVAETLILMYSGAKADRQLLDRRITKHNSEMIDVSFLLAEKVDAVEKKAYSKIWTFQNILKASMYASVAVLCVWLMYLHDPDVADRMFERISTIIANK